MQGRRRKAQYTVLLDVAVVKFYSKTFVCCEISYNTVTAMNVVRVEGNFSSGRKDKERGLFCGDEFGSTCWQIKHPEWREEAAKDEEKWRN